MATSNTYSFAANTQLDDLFREAYERIGIIGNDQTPLNVKSAIMSANLELSSWPGRGLNLWLVQRKMFSIYPNQPIYVLPTNTVRVLEVSAITPNRLNSGGTAFSSAGGNAANCFDPNQNSGCIQNTPNGSISYDYGEGNSNSILYVGVAPLNNSTYKLSVDYSFDNQNWINVYNSPSENFIAGQALWFVIQKAVNARAWRIRESGGETLAIQQIYFAQPSSMGPGDRALTALSRSEYIALSSKMSTGFSSGFYFDETITPTMTLWPVPSESNQATAVLYTNYRYAQDINFMFENAEIPQRFYDALVSGISARLAVKFAPDKYPMMKADALEAYAVAAKTDFENVALRFQPDLTSFNG